MPLNKRLSSSRSSCWQYIWIFSQVSLSINILLSLTVFFLLLAEIIPPTSLVVPLLGNLKKENKFVFIFYNFHHISCDCKWNVCSFSIFLWQENLCFLRWFLTRSGLYKINYQRTIGYFIKLNNLGTSHKHFSICVTIVVLNIHFRSPQTHTMAPWIRWKY